MIYSASRAVTATWLRAANERLSCLEEEDDSQFRGRKNKLDLCRRRRSIVVKSGFLNVQVFLMDKWEFESIQRPVFEAMQRFSNAVRASAAAHIPAKKLFNVRLYISGYTSLTTRLKTSNTRHNLIGQVLRTAAKKRPLLSPNNLLLLPRFDHPHCYRTEYEVAPKLAQRRRSLRNPREILHSQLFAICNSSPII